MAKKIKRTVRRTTAIVGASPTRSEPSGAEFHPDYGYVRSDLRRIAILAGGFLLFLVVLSLLVK